ncbi:hypothetical protein B0H21DRAFT_21333 [Amylocystis lapponica]|nr:hypothetical protein B0H21DRAFT_21333 [Amylocystis lapponica]
MSFEMSFAVPNPVLLLAGVLLALGVFTYRKIRLAAHTADGRAGVAEKVGAQPSSSRAAAKVNTPDREAGEWTPVAFDYPRVEPFVDDLKSVKPVPYRPFRWGDYHVTMGIRSMPWDQWIELDRQFFDYHRICEHRIRTRGDRAVRVNSAQPGVVESGHAGARELVYEIAEYVSRRYPTVYHATRHAVSEKRPYGWRGEGQIKEITIVPLEQTYNLDEEDPMTVAALLVQEDLIIMVEGTDGQYYFQAGAVCIPGFWRLEDKIGMPLEQIHISGNVPQYQNKLQLSMSRFFRRLPLDKPVVRNNYGFQVVHPPERAEGTNNTMRTLDPTELAWSNTMHGDEDKVGYARGAHIRTDEGTAKSEGEQKKKAGLPFAVTAPMVHLRTERQTLRRLPRTGAIAFTVRVYQTPIVELAREPGVPGRMASAIRSWPEDVAEYKDQLAYLDILEYLDEAHAAQVEKGETSADEQPSAYPY